MLTIRLDEDVPSALRGARVALGNFDGVHTGHRAVIEAARRLGPGGPLAVATFDPAPRRFFQPDAPAFRILTPVRRELVLEALHVDACFLVPFDAQLAGLSAEQFVSDVLNARMGAAGVAVGFDFRFGRNREGDAAALSRLTQAREMACEIVAPVVSGEAKVSSSQIRAFLSEGDMAEAARLLGSWWIVDGVVEAGEQRGRTLGFPTANFRLGDLVQPAFGVYAVWARIDDEADWRPGVASFGRTPTTGLREPLLETVLFDWAGDLYGRRLHVAFARMLRPELHFDSLDELVTRMHADAAQARTVLVSLSPPSGR